MTGADFQYPDIPAEKQREMIDAGQDAARRGYRGRRCISCSPSRAARWCSRCTIAPRRRGRNDRFRGRPAGPRPRRHRSGALAAGRAARRRDLCAGRVQPGPDPACQRQSADDGAGRRGAAPADLRRQVHAIRWDDERRLCARRLAARARRHRRSAQVHAARRRLEGHGADLAVVAAAGRTVARRAGGRRDPLRQGDRARRAAANATASRTRGSARSATAS